MSTESTTVRKRQRRPRIKLDAEPIGDLLSALEKQYSRAEVTAAFHEAGHVIAFLAMPFDFIGVELLSRDEALATGTEGLVVARGRLWNQAKPRNGVPLKRRRRIARWATLLMAGMITEHMFFGDPGGGGFKDFTEFRKLISPLQLTEDQDLAFQAEIWMRTAGLINAYVNQISIIAQAVLKKRLLLKSDVLRELATSGLLLPKTRRQRWHGEVTLHALSNLYRTSAWIASK